MALNESGSGAESPAIRKRKPKATLSTATVPAKITSRFFNVFINLPEQNIFYNENSGLKKCLKIKQGESGPCLLGSVKLRQGFCPDLSTGIVERFSLDIEPLWRQPDAESRTREA
ncbi:hypothetical protein HMH01_04350 [Halovulum dunhuangense]|uniref:Uncharacterized protein n=1 Tax=Halovulum dunhuangense TaxID=1505036 RepID=A0A849KZ25_9RHOB|nr:hypothetical protein [Halovulum dunhuangense]NNU79666.1 hypothetical protein [Halovulum dunhuangense]